MPGLFDGMRIASSGIRVHRILQEVVGQNIANASNEDYTRQQVVLGTMGTIFDGSNYLGQGVDVRAIKRVRDELLDTQLRSAQSSAEKYEVQVEWLNKLQAVYNEPSDHGISAGLADFWEAWTDVGNDPESFATRSSVISRTNNLTSLIRDVDSKLARFQDEIDTTLNQHMNEANLLLEEISLTNREIFEIEAGRTPEANDLHDKRDAALDKLSKLLDISYSESENGMTNVYVTGHPAVIEDSYEKLEAKQDTIDPSKQTVYWEHGDRFIVPKNGKIAGIIDVRDNIIPQQRSDLDSFVATLVDEVNTIFSNGVSLDGDVVIESKLGYDAFNVSNSTTALNLTAAGAYGSLAFTFYDSSKDAIRMASIMVDNDDTLNEIAQKINNLPGLDAVLVSDTTNDGRLRITLDTVSGENFLGETSFAISNNTGGFDSSGFLDLVGFSQTDKSTNLSAAAPVLTGVDLSTLQTQLGVGNVAAVRAAALNMAGTFTINGFETLSESTPKTDGHVVQQFTVEVVSTDSIDSIIAKINALTAQYGIAASVNGSDEIELTSTARTDANGELQLAGGTDYLRLGFANDYRYPAAPNDEPPVGYTGRSDTTGILKTLQFNTLFEGTKASDIQLDSRIQDADDVHGGYKLAASAGGLAQDMAALQHQKVANSNQFTIAENFENFIADVGTDVQQAQNLSENERLLVEGFKSERDRISGVNLDEELALMIQYQRSYEANARLFSTFDQMAQEILQLVR